MTTWRIFAPLHTDVWIVHGVTIVVFVVVSFLIYKLSLPILPKIHFVEWTLLLAGKYIGYVTFILLADKSPNFITEIPTFKY